jgi:hypothetical protein
MRHGQRLYLQYLKRVRQPTVSVVSPIVRQVRKPLTLFQQVSDVGCLI